MQFFKAGNNEFMYVSYGDGVHFVLTSFVDFIIAQVIVSRSTLNVALQRLLNFKRYAAL